MIIGIVYILYGLLKITIGICVMTFPPDVLEKIPVVSAFAQKHEDETLAGRLYEYVFIAFGIFTALNGLALLSVLPHALTMFFEAKMTEYAVFIVLGLILTVFYSLVLFTNLPIEKRKVDYKHYAIFGIGSGLAFLCMPLFWELMAYAIPAFKRLSIQRRSMLVISLSIVIVVIADIVYSFAKKNDIHPTDVVPPAYVITLNKVQHTIL